MDESLEEETYLNIMIALLLDEEADDDVPERATWESDYLKTRDESGAYAKLFRELYTDAKNFRKYTRITPQIFDMLLQLVKPSIEKKDTVMRKSIPTGLCIIKMQQFLSHA